MSISVRFTPVSDAALDYIADNMREADRREVWESHGVTPAQAVHQSAKASCLASVAWWGPTPFAAFGLAKVGLVTGTGSPWLLGTPDIESHRREFLRYTREGIQIMLDVCPRLENYVHVEHTKSIRWLKSLGCSFGDPAPIGRFGGLFMKFTLGVM